MTKELSFNQLQKACESHVQDEETKKCFCDVTGVNCRKISCPKLEGESDEQD